MQFYEIKKNNKFIYTVDEVFGEITITSPEQLPVEKLDNVFMAIFETHKKESAQTIESKVKGTEIYYTFNKKPMWEDIEEENND
jgi:hypothetical protein